MQSMRALYSRRNGNLVSWLIRWGLPRSRFAIALVSHGMLVDGDYVIQATMWHGWRETLRTRRLGGVQRVLMVDALIGQTIIKDVTYSVPDAEAGLAWARSQVGKPYDFKGAFGMAIDPERDWQEPDCWFCFELIASALQYAHRIIFESTGHITGTVLMLIKP